MRVYNCMHHPMYYDVSYISYSMLFHAQENFIMFWSALLYLFVFHEISSCSTTFKNVLCVSRDVPIHFMVLKMIYAKP